VTQTDQRPIPFGFAGRVSTEDNQDPEASRNWQLSRARALIEPVGGFIVSEYFDIGQSRSLPWSRRPRAAELLAALADPHRGFDAVVIGEPQRAFYATSTGSPYRCSPTTACSSGFPRSAGRSTRTPKPMT
jgi:site-specific DNA recombinase